MLCWSKKWNHLWQFHLRRPSWGILPDLAAWQSATLLVMCFHPKRRTGFESTRAQAAASVRKERRLHRQVEWQIQVARRNINSFWTSEQRTSCRGESEIKRANLWYDRCIRRVKFVCLSLNEWVCVYSKTCLQDLSTVFCNNKNKNKNGHNSKHLKIQKHWLGALSLSTVVGTKVSVSQISLDCCLGISAFFDDFHLCSMMRFNRDFYPSSVNVIWVMWVLEPTSVVVVQEAWMQSIQVHHRAHRPS